MRRGDGGWLVTLLVVIALTAVAWLAGGAIRSALLLLGRTPDFASDVGALGAAALFVLLVLGYLLYDHLPWPQI